MSKGSTGKQEGQRVRAAALSGERALLFTFVGVALAFLVAHAYTQRAVRRIDEASDEIAFNSAPSVQRLAAVRTSVRHVQYHLGFVLPLSSDDRSQIDEAVTQLKDDASAYLSLPAFEGERSYWDELNESIGMFDAVVQRALAVRGASSAQATKAIIDDVANAADRVTAAAAAAVDFNARNLRDLAVNIKTVRRNAEWIGYGLNTSLAAFTLLAGILVRRSVRNRRALVEERAAMQEERAAELESFAGRVAHDILNPVSATQLALGLASKREVSEEKARELIERGQRNLGRIRTIIDDLLRFARAGARPCPGASADVAAVVKDVSDEIRPAAEDAGIELCVESLSPCRASCSVGVLTSVVSNLAHNALKYIGDAATRRITLRSRACFREKRDLVRVEVEDSGPGIPEELAGQLFRPFVQGPHAAEGLGLGLATVKRLCESHGGQVGICSAVGRGSTFWVELPRAEGSAEKLCVDAA
jgi:signal transduction histidine kinase